MQKNKFWMVYGQTEEQTGEGDSLAGLVKRKVLILEGPFWDPARAEKEAESMAFKYPDVEIHVLEQKTTVMTETKPRLVWDKSDRSIAPAERPSFICTKCHTGKGSPYTLKDAT